MLYVPFDVLINMCNEISPYICVRFVVDRRLSFIPSLLSLVTHFRSTSTVFRILHTIVTDFLYLRRKWRYARMNVRKVPYFWPIFINPRYRISLKESRCSMRARGQAGGRMERHDEAVTFRSCCKLSTSK